MAVLGLVISIPKHLFDLLLGLGRALVQLPLDFGEQNERRV